MNLIIDLLEKYSEKFGTSFHTELCLEENSATLRFVKGKPEARGGTAVYVMASEILEILAINGIIGESGTVRKVLDSDSRDKDSEIENLIYKTLARYISQMLEAAMGRNHVPELKYLLQHKIYFYFASTD